MARFTRVDRSRRLMLNKVFNDINTSQTSHSHLSILSDIHKAPAMRTHGLSRICTSLRHGVPIRSSSSSNNINLNKQQRDIIEAISDGKSVFITGSAGSGKTFLLSEAIKNLKQIYGSSKVFVTGYTGVAATAIDGQTIHSFAGVSGKDLGSVDQQLLLQKVLKYKPALMRWRGARALVIDEVSMMSAQVFNNLQFIASAINDDCDRIWGGIQLIVSGDFFQLPPVDGEEFAFEAECWKDCFHLQVELTEIFRQKSDAQLIDLLQGIRIGQINEYHLQILQQCCHKPDFDMPVRVPHIYPRIDDVKRVNENWLKKLDGDIKRYTARDTGSKPWKGIAPDELELCTGARVMLIKNKDMENGLVNGATGTVVDFVNIGKNKYKKISATGYLPMVEFDSGVRMMIEPEKWQMMEGDKRKATRKQIPLILAWAVSIHKCQGMTLDCLCTDLSRAFGYGMVYVALSRARSLKGLYLSGFDPSKIVADPKVVEFYENLSCSLA